MKAHVAHVGLSRSCCLALSLLLLSGIDAARAQQSTFIICPANGDTFITPTTILLGAEANTQVEFFAGTNRIGTGHETAGDCGRWTLWWSNVPPAQYTLRAKTIDASSVSDPVFITVFDGVPNGEVRPAPRDQQQPAVAANDQLYFVVWADQRNFNNNEWDIYGARVTPQGDVLDTNGIPICVLPGIQNYPSVASDGRDFFVVWTDGRDQNGATSFDIYGARVTAEGAVVESNGFPICRAPDSQFGPSVAFNGTNYLLAWYDYRNSGGDDIYGARVSSSGTLLDADGIPICTAENGQWSPGVASLAGDFFVAWDDSRESIRGTRVSVAGRADHPDGLVLSPHFSGYPIRVAANTSGYLAVWTDGRDYETTAYNIFAHRVNARGEPTGADLVLCNAADMQVGPAVTAAGEQFLAVWLDDRFGYRQTSIFGTRIGTNGVLNPNGIFIGRAASSAVWNAPATASLNGQYLVAWVGGRDDGSGETDIVGARLTADGTVLDGNAFLISTILSNPPPPVIVSIVATDPDASEIPVVPPWLDIAQRSDPAVFTVTRTGQTDSPLTVFYTVGGTASNGIDYSDGSSGFREPLPGRVTIPAGAFSATINVEVIDDLFVEGPETVELTVLQPPCIAMFPPPPDCYLVGESNHAVAYILDNDVTPPPVVTIVASDPNAAEKGSDTGTFTVSRTGDTNNPLLVFYDIGGTAESGEDYLEFTNIERFFYLVTGLPNVVIPAGASSADIVVTPIDDNLPEGPESVHLQLRQPEWAGYVFGVPSNAVVIIADDDLVGTNVPPQVQMVTPRDGDTFVGPTNILLGANAFDRDGSVTQVEFFSGTQSLGLARGPLRTPYGTWVLTWSNVVPGRYTLTARATDQLGAVGVSTPVNVTVTGNPPPPQLTLDEPRDGQQFSTGESIPLRASLANDLGGPWRVEFFSGDDPVADSVPGQTVWWTEAWGGKHLLTARATNFAGTTLISDPITIQVGPGATLPVVRISGDPWRTAEPCPTCRMAPSVLTIHRTDPTNAPLTVYLAIDGTATPGEDYEALPTSVEIPAGQHAAQLTLVALDDQLIEGPEIVRVRVLRQPPPLQPPTYFIAYNGDTALIVINDDEAGAPSARLDIVAPANGAHLRFPCVVELSAMAVYTSNEVYGPVEFYAGDELVARSPVNASTRPPIAGLPSVHTAYWTNPPVGQYVLSARAQLSFSLSVTSSPVNVTVDAPALPVVSLETVPSENAQAPEYCPPNADCAYPSFVVRRAGPTNEDLRVYLTYSGTATPVDDYRALPQSVAIPAGQRAASLMVLPVSDPLIEGPETIVASFTPIPAPLYIEDPAHSSATITIIDGGAAWPRAWITSPTNGAQFPPNEAIYLTADARGPDGYITTMEFFADGCKIREQNIQFIRPPDPGQTQNFEFVWREPMPGSHVLNVRAIDNLTRSAISLPVQIDVRLPELPLVAVFATDHFAAEPSSNRPPNTAAFRIQRFGSTNSPLTVACSFQGTGQNGIDYETLPEEILIPAGNSWTTVIVRPLPDDLAEPIETVILQLQASAQYTFGFHSQAVAVISDNPSRASLDTRWTRLPDGHIHLRFATSTTDNFRLEASGDLRNWETVSVTAAADGTTDFIEELLPNLPCRFYRVAPEPANNPTAY